MNNYLSDLIESARKHFESTDFKVASTEEKRNPLETLIIAGIVNIDSLAVLFLIFFARGMLFDTNPSLSCVPKIIEHYSTIPIYGFLIKVIFNNYELFKGVMATISVSSILMYLMPPSKPKKDTINFNFFILTAYLYLSAISTLTLISFFVPISGYINGWKSLETINILIICLVQYYIRQRWVKQSRKRYFMAIAYAKAKREKQ